MDIINYKDMKNLRYTLVLLLSIGLFSCETDVDVNAEYVDITTVYGLINPTETVHYVKVNKAFLGTGSALDLAADADNFNYADGEIVVTMNAYNNSGSLEHSYTGTRTVNEIVKYEGVFDNSSNVLYRFNFTVNRGFKYKVKVVNSSLDKEVTAETQIVGTTLITNPSTSTKFQFWNGLVASGNPLNKTFVAKVGTDVGRAGMILLFNYTQFYSNGADSTAHVVRMPIADVQTISPLGNENIEWVLEGQTFFSNIDAAVSDASAVSFLSYRRLDNISLEFSIGGTELNTFMEVGAPSSSVNQDKPNYTNVENGLGLLSSREKILWTSSIDPVTSQQLNIQNSTIRYLSTSSLLANKGFCFGTFDPNTTNNPVAPCN